MAKTNAELQEEIKKLNAKIFEIEAVNESFNAVDFEALKSENAELQKQIEILQQPIEDDFDESFITVNHPTYTVDQLTRNDIIKGLLPSLPLNIHNAEAHVGNLLNCADILLKKING